MNPKASLPERAVSAKDRKVFTRILGAQGHLGTLRRAGHGDEPMAEELGRWFKIYAAITEHKVFSDAQALRAFIWCCKRACWRDTYSHGKQIPRGSFWTTNRDAADECHSAVGTWRKAMAGLEQMELVVWQRTKTHSLIRVINYVKYQGESADSRVSKSDTRTDTPSDTRTDTQADTQTDTRSRSIRTGSNVEEIPTATPSGESVDKPAKTPKAKPAAYDPRTVDLPPAINTPKFREAWAAWCDHRKEIRKPVTPRSVTQQLQWCAKLGQSHAIESIRYTIMKGWQGLVESPQQAPKLTPKEIPSLPGFKPLPTLDEVLRAKIATAGHGTGADRGAGSGSGGTAEGVRATG
jgi:hypothetical protein